MATIYRHSLIVDKQIASVEGACINVAEPPPELSNWKDPLPCPMCRQTATLEAVQDEREDWLIRAVEKNGGVRDKRWLEVSDGCGGVRQSALNVSFVRCLGCGCLYDPWVKKRASIERANIQRLKNFVQHPLEQLADCARDSDDPEPAH